MPYIKQHKRERVNTIGPVDTGELTYQIYQACINFTPDGARFEDFSQVIAALECAKLEYYRRHVAPYEEQKLEYNGDITNERE